MTTPITTMDLPSAKQLARLPCRAVVAYAVRNSQRLIPYIKSDVPREILEKAIDLSGKLSTSWMLSELNEDDLAIAAYDVVKACQGSSSVDFSIGLSVSNAVWAALYTLMASSEPQNARRHMEHIAKAAVSAARTIDFLEEKQKEVATQYAYRDYVLLRATYGESDDVLIGEPVDCFDEGD